MQPPFTPAGADRNSPAAIDDALGRPGTVHQLPITPDRLHALLAEAGEPRR